MRTHARLSFAFATLLLGTLAIAAPLRGNSSHALLVAQTVPTMPPPPSVPTMPPSPSAPTMPPPPTAPTMPPTPSTPTMPPTPAAPAAIAR